MSDLLPGIERLLAREGEQPLRELRAALGPFDGIVQEPEDVGITGFQSLSGDIQRADHHRQHVVEVVRDPSGQLADGFHFLRLTQLQLDRFALVHFSLEAFMGSGEGGMTGLDLAPSPRGLDNVERSEDHSEEKRDDRQNLDNGRGALALVLTLAQQSVFLGDHGHDQAVHLIGSGLGFSGDRFQRRGLALQPENVDAVLQGWQQA